LLGSNTNPGLLNGGGSFGSFGGGLGGFNPALGVGGLGGFNGGLGVGGLGGFNPALGGGFNNLGFGGGLGGIFFVYPHILISNTLLICNILL
jgi:hypothetical protein